jgi:DNA-binding transcriptional ArsR family regulator
MRQVQSPHPRFVDARQIRPRAVGRTIVHDQEFPIGAGLSQHRLDGWLQVLQPIERRQDDRDRGSSHGFDDTVCDEVREALLIGGYCETIQLRLYCNHTVAFEVTMRRDVFQAIADPTRRAIISLVALQAMTPNALAEHFDTSRQAVSKHLRILTECQLLRQELSGREIYYHFNPKEMKEVADFIEPFRRLWDTKFSQLEKVLTKLKPRKP